MKKKRGDRSESEFDALSNLSSLFFKTVNFRRKKTKIGNTSSTNPTTLPTPFQSTHTQAYTKSRDSE